MAEDSNGVAYIDGRIVPIDQAKISICDWGFLHSDATYDVAHVWDGKFFRLSDHIDRFFNAMGKLRMSIPHGRDGVQSILVDCVRASGLRQAYVEMICTRGIPQPGSRDPRTCKNRFYAFAVPFIWLADPDKQARGLHLVVSRQQRIPPASVDPTVKNYHWLDLVMGLFEAYDLGGETTVLVDGRGNLVEGPGFNIFCVKARTLTTPGHGVLEGITRRTVIEMAADLGYRVRLRNLQAQEARTADELFATSTAGGIIPIRQIDRHIIGSGTPGSVTRELKQKYWALHKEAQYTLTIDY